MAAWSPYAAAALPLRPTTLQSLSPLLSPSPVSLLQQPYFRSRCNDIRDSIASSKSSYSQFLLEHGSCSGRMIHKKDISYSRLHVTVKCQLRFPLVSPDDHWGVWAALLAIGAFGIWSERTKIGSMVSAALVSTLVGLAASNVGIIPHHAPAYSIVMEYLLPLMIPLLLFRANLRQLIQSTGPLFLAFLLGSVGTIVGTLVAFFLVPMRSLGQDNWKIAASFMASYIGGTVNYVAVSEALGVSPSVLAAGVAADNVICAIYFIVLFALSSKIPSEAPTSSSDDPKLMKPDSEGKFGALQIATVLAVSFSMCKFATWLARLLRITAADLPAITAIAIMSVTLLPTYFFSLAPAGEAIAIALMQVFFAVVGASGSIWNIMNTAPGIFMFALVQVTVHLAVTLGLGRLFGFDKKLLLLASNANIGGPTTACGMATAKGWNSLVVPGILAGIFGISISTFLAIAFALLLLKHM